MSVYKSMKMGQKGEEDHSFIRERSLYSSLETERGVIFVRSFVH